MTDSQWRSSISSGALTEMEYVNRRGNRYYVLQGETKTGKPKYYCSKKAGGQRVTQLPSEYEIFEHPSTAVVTVRRVKPSDIRGDEVEFITTQVRSLSKVEYFIVQPDGNSILVYTCDMSSQDINELFGIATGLQALLRVNPMIQPSPRMKEKQAGLAALSQYTPMLRFTLTDAINRIFLLDRWCFRGSVDGWIELELGQLDSLTAEYLPHLGDESFYDLI